MTAHDVDRYRQRLRDSAERLDRQVATLRGEAMQPTGAASGAATDAQADPGAQAADEGLAVTLLGSEEHTLEEVTAALDRIDRGSFGRCERCGQSVGRPRLDTLPHARHCIECARRAEAGQDT